MANFILIVLVSLFCYSDAHLCRVTAPIDLVYVIDGSTSVGAENFKYVTEFIASFTETLPTGSTVAAVQFTERPQTEFDFTKYISLHDAANHIKTIALKEGATQANYALIHTHKNILNTTANSKDRKDYMLMVTDGRSADDPWPTAEVIRNMNVTTIAIGITKYADDYQLHAIAGAPDMVFHVDDFKDLDSWSGFWLKEKLWRILCKGSIDIIWPLKFSKDIPACEGLEDCAYYYNGLELRTCLCSDPFVGRTCTLKHPYGGGGARCYSGIAFSLETDARPIKKGELRPCHGLEVCTKVNEGGIEEPICRCVDPGIGKTCGLGHPWPGSTEMRCHKAYLKSKRNL